MIEPNFAMPKELLIPEFDCPRDKRSPRLLYSFVYAITFCLTLIGGQTRAAEIFTVKHDTGTGNGATTNYGQSFTANSPGIGVPLAGNPDNAYLYSMGIRAGNNGSGSGTYYLNIYDSVVAPGDSGAGAFVGSSTTSVAPASMSPDDYITWNFNGLSLDYDGGTKYFAVLSSTNVAGSIVNGQSFRLDTNNGYSGGTLLHNSGELNTHDARFTVVMSDALGATSVTAQIGQAATHGIPVADATGALTDVLATNKAEAQLMNFDETVSLDFNYAPVSVDQIVSATLTIDTFDSDGRRLDLSAGGVYIGGTANSGDVGAPPSTWHGLGTADNVDNTFAIPETLFSDLADGSFSVTGDWSSTANGWWGGNRAILTINAVPEPTSFALAAFGLIGLIGFGRRRKQ
jgi:hypothetical protein